MLEIKFLGRRCFFFFFLIFGNRNFLRVYLWHEAFRLERKCHLLPTMHYFPTLFLSFSTQSCRPSFLSAYISVDSQHVVPASLRRHVGISVHIGRSRRIDATSQLRLRLMTSITLAHFWLLLQSRCSRCRNQGG